MRVDKIWLYLPVLVASPIRALTNLSYESLIDLARRDVYSDCLNVDFSEVCKKGPADCFAAMCNACRDVVVIAECCGLASDSAKLVCLNNAMANPAALTLIKPAASTSTGRVSSITATPIASVAPIPGLAACAGVLTTWQSCQSQTSQFAMLAFNQQAQCLCYNKYKALNASAYDGPWSTCLAYASATSPAFYSSLTQNWGAERAPCSKIGNLNSTSVFASSTVWYIGYSVDPAAQPTAQPPGQSSALPVVTATVSSLSKPNHAHRNILDSVRLGIVCLFTLTL